MRAGRIVSTVAGALLALLGLSLVLAGGGLTFLHTQRDADGWLTTPSADLSTDGYALSTDQALLLDADPGTGWVPFLDRLEVRVEVVAADEDVFVGIAPSAELERYLDGVAHAEVQRLGTGDRSRLRGADGTRALEPPGTLDVWTASTTGPAPTVLRWSPEAGSWAGVITNADGSPGVAVTIRAGVRTTALLPLGLLVALAGLVFLVVGAVLVLAGLGGARPPAGTAGRDAAPGAPVATPGGARTPANGTYPLRLEASLAPDLGRWRWLVKWLLAIPHVVVLVLLWAAFAVLTVVAGIAILFTGRYPRPVFDFNVGVLRWTWRVHHYGFGVLGTDRYPPFTLEDVADYPAHLEVAYPERLSRGLVLVKWWLLVLPHYLVVAVLVGGGITWTTTGGADEIWRLSLGGGLVGILVLIAAISLLFSARYPPRLFDLVVGCQRWVYRVMVYAALMTDEYPPFRLDQGGREPPVGGGPEPPPPPPVGASRPPRPVAHGARPSDHPPS
ncbi:DUF4389 domain-containing protein [Nitriliruptoraceae bacterium ZYF776]|nr:DUF4389 domain-containing protein [Profundirhabdus halotolerans]